MSAILKEGPPAPEDSRPVKKNGQVDSAAAPVVARRGGGNDEKVGGQESWPSEVQETPEPVTPQTELFYNQIHMYFVIPFVVIAVPCVGESFFGV